MIDMLELKARNPLADLVEQRLGPPRQRSVNWWLWLCPFHQDKKTPSFAVNLKTNTWRCFGACGEGGDAISFVMKYESLDFKAACERIANGSPPETPEIPPHPAMSPELDLDCWQTQAIDFMVACEYELHSVSNARALSYLTEYRGLCLETIRRYRLGYNPADRYDPGHAWGFPDDKPVWLPRGIVIPCLANGRVYYLNVRRPQGDPKYIKARGSRSGIFGYANLRGAWLAVLTEGEFDAMLLDQQAGDLAGIATLGAASNRIERLAEWPYLLGIRHLLYVGDVDLAGLRATGAIEALTHRARRACLSTIPGIKDLTDYHRSGGDLAAWLVECAKEMAIESA